MDTQGVKDVVHAALAKYLVMVRNEAKAWLEEHGSDEAVGSDVLRTLNRERDAIIAKLLGFDNTFGRWEVDHCNGRNGESAVGDFLRKHAKEHVDRWLISQAQGLPDLPKGAVEALRRDYLDSVKDALQSKIQELAGMHAAKLAEQIANEFGLGGFNG